MVRTGKLLYHDTTVLLFMGIRLEKTSLGRIIVRSEGYTPSHNLGIVVNEAHHGHKNGVRMGHAALYLPEVFPHAGLCQFKGVRDFGSCRTQYHVTAGVHLLLHDAHHAMVLNNGNNLHQRSGNDHDTQTDEPSFSRRIHISPKNSNFILFLQRCIFRIFVLYE